MHITAPPPRLLPRATSMRRPYIYPHRSVRSFPLSRLRVCTAATTALLLCAATIYFGSWLLSAHSRASSFLLSATRIPSTGVKPIEIYPIFGSVTAPDTPFPQARAHPWRTVLIFATSMLALILIHRRIPLSRNFIIFLMILLCASAVVIVLNPSFYFDSAMFQQIWLRGEILVWIMLPWVSAFLFILTLPSVAAGLGWSLLLQLYAIAWSAVRLAFCLGILHYTGILFLPLLWFSLGILFDLVYVLVFYSLALRGSITKAGGERTS